MAFCAIRSRAGSMFQRPSNSRPIGTARRFCGGVRSNSLRTLGYGAPPAPMPRRSRHKQTAIDPAALREELLRRSGIDRAARSAYTGAPAEMARLMEMDSNNTAWLMAIVEDIGWPGYSLVGEDAAHAAWLLAQHADLNPAFQRHCLKLLRRAVRRGEASSTDLAHLHDRVSLASGKPQLYGTQVIVRDGRYVPARLRNAQTVDARRAAVGLEPIAAHLRQVLDRRGPPQPLRCPCPGCGETIALWPPEPGGTTRFKCPACGATGAHAGETAHRPDARVDLAHRKNLQQRTPSARLRRPADLRPAQ